MQSSDGGVRIGRFQPTLQDSDRTLTKYLESYEREETSKEKETTSESLSSQGAVDASEELSTFLLRNGMQRLAVAVLAFPYVDVSAWLRSANSQTENHIFTHLVRVAPVMVKHVLQSPFHINGTSNSCVFKAGDRYFVNCRVVNYKLDREIIPNHFILPNGIDYFQSSNVLLEMSSNFQQVLGEKVFENEEGESGPVRGVEDVRVLVLNDGKMYYAGTIFHNNRLVISHHLYDPDQKRIVRQPIASPFDRKVEKNWAMFEYNGEIRFVYQWYPIQIGKVVSSKLDIVIQRDHDLDLFKRVKGSSCGVYDSVSGCLWFLVHVRTDNEFRQYYHMLVLLDPNTFAIQKVSCPFTFEKERVEFGMGLIVEPTRVVMTYTVFDETARVVVFERQKIESTLFGRHSFYEIQVPRVRS